jgi:hypothetical protein
MGEYILMPIACQAAKYAQKALQIRTFSCLSYALSCSYLMPVSMSKLTVVVALDCTVKGFFSPGPMPAGTICIK